MDNLNERISSKTNGLGAKPTSSAPSFPHVTDLEQTFVGSKLGQLPQELDVGTILYKFAKTNDIDFNKLIRGTGKGYAIYTIHQNARNVYDFNKLHTSNDDPQSIQNAVVLAWGIKSHTSNDIVPLAARSVPKIRIAHNVNAGLLEGSNEIGLSPEAIVIGLNNNKPMESKTDTGADMCSMHVDFVEVTSGTVTFKIGSSTFNTPLVNTLQVKQADSSGESRPVIKCNISVNGLTVRDVEVNLNNRDGMVPLLLGKNFLQQGGFQIKVEDIDWDQVDALFEDVVVDKDETDVQITV